MAFLSDIFGRMGRVARGQANAGVDAMEDATFEATVRQTVADMKTELNNVVRASAMAMNNYNRLQAEYDKYVRQSQEWKDRAGLALDAGNEDLAKKQLISPQEKDELDTERVMNEAELKRDQEALKQRTILSPINGVVVERYLSAGELVRQDKARILKLAQLDPLNVEVVVPSASYGSIRVGTVGEVSVADSASW